MKFGIIGTSIWQQNQPLLERLTLDRDTQIETLQAFKEKLGLAELIYLPTCNRVEFIYAASEEISDSRILHGLIDFFVCNRSKISFFPNDLYQFTGREALTHLFRTVSSLESLVVGETQITGQFKQASVTATETNLSGPVLNKIAQQALQVAKKVRRETSLGEGSLSMASLAATELKAQLGHTERPTIALVGSGPMTAKMVKYIKNADFLFVNRTVAKAEKLAAEFGGTAMSLEAFVAQPPEVDAIISATAAVEPVFEGTFLTRLVQRANPVACVDLAVPRDFSTDFAISEKVKLVDVPLLKTRGQGNLRQKFSEVSKANELVREAVTNHLAGQVEASLKPIMQESYQESLVLAKKALNDLFANQLKSLDSKEQDSVHRLVTKLIGHSSFQPAKLLSDRLVELRSDVSLSSL